MVCQAGALKQQNSRHYRQRLEVPASFGLTKALVRQPFGYLTTVKIFN
jgi:hypothetical protein